MSLCVEFVQIKGQLSLQPVPIPLGQSPVVCNSYLLLTSQEFSSTQTPFFVPLSMSDGALISAAILSVWGLAFVFKTLRKSFDPSTNGDSP